MTARSTLLPLCPFVFGRARYHVDDAAFSLSLSLCPFSVSHFVPIPVDHVWRCSAASIVTMCVHVALTRSFDTAAAHSL